MKFTLEHMAGGCNRQVQAVSWGHQLAAFGVHNFVCIYDPQQPDRVGIQKTLKGHTNKVNCVQVLSKDGKDIAILSTSADKSLKVWYYNQEWKFISSEGHTGSVNVIAHIPWTYKNFNHLIVTAGADSKVVVWGCKIEESKEPVLEKIQEFNFGFNFATSLGLAILPQSKTPLLAIGKVDCKVHFYYLKEDGNNVHFVDSVSVEGHEDWIKYLSFAQISDEQLMLASCSQDKYIRIWQISSKILEGSQKSAPTPSEILESITEDDGKKFLFSLKGENFEVEENANGQKVRKIFSVVLDALLIGHEDIVSSVVWHPKMIENGKLIQPKCILSASMDKSMMIWRPDPESGVWINEVRVGEIGGQNTLGFFNGLFNKNGTWILGHSYNGAFHLWEKSGDMWQPKIAIEGHFAEVNDLCWEPNGNYFVSVSSDQTARLISNWDRTEGQTKKSTYHEIARPQVHGYDLQSIAFTTDFEFASGAEEKVVRVFGAPQSFLSNLEKISQVTVKSNTERPLAAATPALGLSNKAIFEGQESNLHEAPGNSISQSMAGMMDDEEGQMDQGDSLYSIKPAFLEQPPFEEHLMQSTLWAETEKLYGHPYEIFSLASTGKGDFLASACKSSHEEHAQIRIWDCKKWAEVACLNGHSLTVTQMEFSNSGKYLLSVSRDRSWCLFTRNGESFEQLIVCQKSHSRILWGCSWSHDDSIFATCSRDKTIKFWDSKKLVESPKETPKPLCTMTASESVTSVSFSNISDNNSYIFAIGLENGEISLHSISKKDYSIKSLVDVDQRLTHTASIKRMKWKPLTNSTHKKENILATAADDHTVRVFKLDLS